MQLRSRFGVPLALYLPIMPVHVRHLVPEEIVPHVARVRIHTTP